MAACDQIEHVLSKRSVQWMLRQLAKQDDRGECTLTRIMATYGRPNLPLKDRLKYALPHLAIDWARRRAGVSVQAVRAGVFDSPSWSRGLVNSARALGEFGLHKPQTFAAPLIVIWNFTQDCNLQCKHCYQDAGTPRGVELSLSEKLRVLDELAQNSVSMLAFSGGEPLMSSDFWPTLAEARARRFHVSVATNGTLLTPEVVDRLATTGADYVEVSIDSARADRHDEFRGRSGYWRRSMAGLKSLIADGRIRTGLACTVTSMNIDEINDVIEMAKDLGVSTFYVFNFIPTGRALNIQDMDITPDQREELLEIMQAHLDEGRISVMGTTPQYGRRCMQHYWLGRTVTTGHYGSSDHSATPLFARYLGGCGAGRCMLAIQPNGDVTPCVFMPIVIGNLRAQRIHDIWRQSEVLWKLRDRDILQGHCGVCEWKLYCGGCRARAYGYFGDVTAPDPGCTFNIDAWRQLRTRERLQRREAQERTIAGQSSGD